MDVIFNLFKIRYKKLDELLTAECPDLQPNSNVNLFINLDCVFRKMADSNLDNFFNVARTGKNYQLISNIINLAAHYRLFFSKNKLYSKVYLYTTFPHTAPLKNYRYNSDYRSYYINKIFRNPSNFLLTKAIKDNLPLVKVITEYLQGVYMVYSETAECSLIPHMITSNTDSNAVNFIVTTDPYDYQYVNQNYYIIRPKQDDSFVVNRKNLWDKFIGETKYNDLNTSFYPIILSVLGDKYRSLGKVKGMGFMTIAKAIKMAIEKNKIGANTTNITAIIPFIKDEYAELVMNNFMCIDINAQIGDFNSSSTMTILNQLVDKFDNANLQRINNDFFKEHPLNLIEIMDATKLLKTNKIFRPY